MSAPSLFGTDGVRGIPGEGPLKPESVRSLAYHAAKVLLERQGVKINGRAMDVLGLAGAADALRAPNPDGFHTLEVRPAGDADPFGPPKIL